MLYITDGGYVAECVGFNTIDFSMNAIEFYINNINDIKPKGCLGCKSFIDFEKFFY